VQYARNRAGGHEDTKLYAAIRRMRLLSEELDGYEQQKDRDKNRKKAYDSRGRVVNGSAHKAG
jgi:hypothetical protein